MKQLFDPIKAARQELNGISDGSSRKYNRFRYARFYGGIATADCMGCCLRCSFCWSKASVLRATEEGFGRMCSPEEVVDRLIQIANAHDIRRFRISGSEPTIHREHLMEVLELIPKKFIFLVETNGIMLGYDRTLVRDLSKFKKKMFVRVGLKGCSKSEFSKLTGAKPVGFDYQIQAIRNLSHYGIDFRPAVMAHFSSAENISKLEKLIEKYGKLEFEKYKTYWTTNERKS